MKRSVLCIAVLLLLACYSAIYASENITPNDSKDNNVTAYYYQRSVAFMKMDKYEKAISDIDKVIELDPKVFGYYNHRGLVYQTALE